jgi:microcystin-dependent protein
MNTIRLGRSLAAALSLGVICLGGTPRNVQAAELPVSYLVDQAKIKTVANGSSLFFQLFANASCSGDPLLTQEVAIEDIALLEDLRLLKRTGAASLAKTARISHVLNGVTHHPLFFLKVLGAFPLPGEECQQQFAPALGTDAPTGVIMLWSGALADIPPGWALCDGANDTPDLRERFIAGVVTGEDPGTTGGADTHSHTVDSHSHTWSDTSGGPSSTTQAGVSGAAASDSHTHDFSGTTSSDSANASSASNLPPYFELAFIMKLL